MKLTNYQKQSYAENGFLIVTDSFRDEELRRLEKGVMRAVRSGRCINGEKTYPRPATQYTVEGQYQDDPDLLFIAEHPAVLEPAEELLGGPACLSAFISYLKTPGAVGTKGDYRGSGSSGHCDYKTYQQAGSSLNWLFAIIPLTDLDEKTGPLLVSPGSHKTSRIVSLNHRVSHVDRASAADIAPMIDTRLRRGDILFMHMFAWHEGKTNYSDNDRFGLYNKYRALNAPPGCGPQFFSEKCFATFSESGKRLLPHHSDLPFAETRLIIEHIDKILLTTHEGGGWHLPRAPTSIDDPESQSVTAKLIKQLEENLADQLGVEIPWMTYVSDFCDANGICRVFAYTDEDGACAGRLSGRKFRWASADEVVQLAKESNLEFNDGEAIQMWSTETCVRGIGQSAERAKGFSPTSAPQIAQLEGNK